MQRWFAVFRIGLEDSLRWATFKDKARELVDNGLVASIKTRLSSVLTREPRPTEIVVENKQQGRVSDNDSDQGTWLMVRSC